MSYPHVEFLSALPARTALAGIVVISPGGSQKMQLPEPTEEQLLMIADLAQKSGVEGAPYDPQVLTALYRILVMIPWGELEPLLSDASLPVDWERYGLG